MTSRATYVIRDGDLVDKRDAAPLHDPSAAPAVHRDQMDPLRHMANGRVSDSKSEHRRWTKEAGCIEVGNDVSAKPRVPIKPPRAAPFIKQAIEQLRSR